jgi:hypothetical protein
MAKTGPYGKLNVPGFEQSSVRKTQEDYWKFFDENAGKGGIAAAKVTEMDQSALTKQLETALGKDWAMAWEEPRKVLVQHALGLGGGEAWEKQQHSIHQARAQSMGVGHAAAGLNLGLEGRGRAAERLQTQALQQLPGYLTAERRERTVKQTRSQEMFIPITQFAAEQASREMNQWRVSLAQNQAQHTAEMANTAYQLQQQQADKAEAESKRRQVLATRNAVAYQNQANWGGGGSWGVSGGGSRRIRSQVGSRMSTNYRIA